MTAYRRPVTLAEALALLAAAPAPPLLLAGGTDIYPARAAAEAWAGMNPGRCWISRPSPNSPASATMATTPASAPG